MKRLTAIVISGVLLALAACGSQNESDSVDASQESNEATETAENAEGQQENTEGASESAPAEEAEPSYSEKEGLTFTSFSPLSLDSSYVLLDKENKEISNNDDKILKSEKTDYKFYDLYTYPADREGYTTAQLTYSCDSDAIVHIKDEDTDNNTLYAYYEKLTLFDYYSGMYISTSEKMEADKPGIGQTSPVETAIQFGDKEWDISAFEENCNGSYNSPQSYTDETHFDIQSNQYSLCTISVTYPDDYDGLSFAINSHGKQEVDMDGLKMMIEGTENENIGKDILTIVKDEGGAKEDMLFYTMKDASSISPVSVSSAEEAPIPSYEESLDLPEAMGANKASDFSCPVEFYIYDPDNEEAGYLSSDVVHPIDPKADYEISGITKLEDDEKARISIPYKVSKTVSVEFNNSFQGNFIGSVLVSHLQAYNRETGESIEVIFDESKDNDSWGDWTDDAHIDYIIDEKYEAVLTFPKEELDDIVIVFGERRDKDSARFNLKDLI